MLYKSTTKKAAVFVCLHIKKTEHHLKFCYMYVCCFTPFLKWLFQKRCPVDGNRTIWAALYKKGSYYVFQFWSLQCACSTIQWTKISICLPEACSEPVHCLCDLPWLQQLHICALLTKPLLLTDTLSPIFACCGSNYIYIQGHFLPRTGTKWVASWEKAP